MSSERENTQWKGKEGNDVKEGKSKDNMHSYEQRGINDDTSTESAKVGF